MRRIYFATTNLKKLREIREIINAEVLHMNVDMVEIQGSIEEIVRYKIDQVIPLVNEDDVVIVDDTGASFDALGGFPGPYMKDFLNIGCKRIAEIMERLGDNRMVVCSGLGIAHYEDGELIKNIFTGECRGVIIAPRNESFDGFHEIFIPDGSDKCFGDMSIEEKNAISNRGIVGRKLVEYMMSVGIIKPTS